MKTNYHSHNYLCRHAKGTVEEYCDKAYSLGYDVFGLSDHGPMPDKLHDELFSRRMSFSDYEEIYLSSCKEVIKKYEGKMKVLKSLELEYFEEMLSMYPNFYSDLDYLILGQHYYKYKSDYINVYQQMDDLRLKAYVDDVVKGLDTGYFKILAHPDIFMNGYPFFDEDCVEASKRIIEACIRNNVLLEINANGIRNCERHQKYLIETLPDGTEYHIYAYPNKNFFKLAATYKNAKFILNDDCHSVDHIDDSATKQAKALCDELGIKLEDSFDLNY